MRTSFIMACLAALDFQPSLLKTQAITAHAHVVLASLVAPSRPGIRPSRFESRMKKNIVPTIGK